MNAPANPAPNPFAASLIRTFVPIIVGYVATILLKLGVHITGDLTPLVTAAVTAGYYLVVRTLEHVSQNPKWGWLLGKAATPVYTANPPAT